MSQQKFTRKTEIKELDKGRLYNGEGKGVLMNGKTNLTQENDSVPFANCLEVVYYAKEFSEKTKTRKASQMLVDDKIRRIICHHQCILRTLICFIRLAKNIIPDGKSIFLKNNWFPNW